MFSRLISLRRARAKTWAHPILLSIGLLDELIVGIPIIALPLLRDSLDLSYEQIGLLFTIAALSGMLIEPFINLLSDHRDQKPWILWGLLLLAGSSALMSISSSYALLLVAFIISYPAGGAAIGLSQAVLIDAAPDDGARTMTRWTLLSSIGDFLAPLVVTTFVALHLGWTKLCWLATTLWLVTSLLLAPLRFPARSKDLEAHKETEEKSILANLREALHDPLLLRWSILAVIPTMLDEVFLSFVVLYLHDVRHVSETIITIIIALLMLASFAGLFALERLLKSRSIVPSQVLAWLALATLIGVLGLLFIHTLWLVTIALVVISASCAGWYPLAQSAAYARKPGNTGVVRTVIGLASPFDMLLPGIIGVISAKFGILAGLGILGCAPVLVLLLLPYQHRPSQ